MTSPADILRQLLINNGLVADVPSNSPWPCYSGFMPESPDNAVCVFDTEGVQDGRMMRTGERIEHPGVMIQWRGTDYAATFALAKTIALFLDSQKQVFIEVESAEAYILNSIKRTGTVNFLGVETEGTKKRRMFSVNLLMSYRAVEAEEDDSNAETDWTDMIQSTTIALTEGTPVATTFAHGLSAVPQYVRPVLRCITNGDQSNLSVGQEVEVAFIRSTSNGYMSPYIVLADTVNFSVAGGWMETNSLFIPLNDGLHNFGSMSNFELVIYFAA